VGKLAYLGGRYRLNVNIMPHWKKTSAEIQTKDMTELDAILLTTKTAGKIAMYPIALR